MEKIKFVLGIALIVLSLAALLCCSVASIVLHFQNPDMTEFRMILEHPYLVIITALALIAFFIGQILKDN